MSHDTTSRELSGAVEVETGSSVTASIIWLHGLGADGHDFEPVVPELRLPIPVRYVFPHAPVRPVTINAGMVMRAWYDLLGLDRTAAQDADGVRDSEAILCEYVRRENERGIPSERIVLAGFSQGGAIALYTGIRYPERLAGLMGLSTYLPLQDHADAERLPVNQETPIFMAHGTLDPMLPASLGSDSRDFLLERGYVVEWHTYPMMHAVCADEVKHIQAWLQNVLVGSA